jgi:hypothetical protein
MSFGGIADGLNVTAALDNALKKSLTHAFVFFERF